MMVLAAATSNSWRSISSTLDEVSLHSTAACYTTSPSVPRNDASEIAEFLSHLTVKSQALKDEFFTSLSARLHSLPPSVVAEHLVPLLLTPLVMSERVARK